MFVPENNIPSISTIIFGPTAHRPISPNVSFLVLLSVLKAVSPIPSASINGTLMGPVVTPLESKAIGMKLLGTKAKSANTKA